MTEELLLSKIKLDGGTQPRAHLDPTIVAEYAAEMTDGSPFPPLTVFYDGESYWLADGFHRLAAAQRLNAMLINVDVRQGTRRDAVLYSAGANALHGLRRSNQDKRRAVQTLLTDEEWGQWSNREIARLTHTSGPFVAKIRTEIPTANISSRTYARNGETQTMDTANIGAEPKEQPRLPQGETSAESNETPDWLQPDPAAAAETEEQTPPPAGGIEGGRDPQPPTPSAKPKPTPPPPPPPPKPKTAPAPPNFHWQITASFKTINGSPLPGGAPVLISAAKDSQTIHSASIPWADLPLEIGELLTNISKGDL